MFQSRGANILRNAAPLGPFWYLPSLPQATLHHVTPRRAPHRTTPHHPPPQHILLLTTSYCATHRHTLIHVTLQHTKDIACLASSHFCVKTSSGFASWPWPWLPQVWLVVFPDDMMHASFTEVSTSLVIPFLENKAHIPFSWLSAITVPGMETVWQSCTSMMQTTWEEMQTSLSESELGGWCVFRLFREGMGPG